MTAGKANACVLAAGAMWGTISIFVRHLDGAGLSALQICLIRTFLAWVMTGAFLASVSPGRLSIRLRDSWCFIGTGIISYALFSTCYFMAVAMSQVSVAVMLLYTSPVFVTLLSAVLFHESMTRWKWLALVCTVTGCVLVAGVLQGHLTVPPSGTRPGTGVGVPVRPLFHFWTLCPAPLRSADRHLLYLYLCHGGHASPGTTGIYRRNPHGGSIPLAVGHGDCHRLFRPAVLSLHERPAAYGIGKSRYHGDHRTFRRIGHRHLLLCRTPRPAKTHRHGPHPWVGHYIE